MLWLNVFLLLWVILPLLQFELEVFDNYVCNYFQDPNNCVLRIIFTKHLSVFNIYLKLCIYINYQRNYNAV